MMSFSNKKPAGHPALLATVMTVFLLLGAVAARADITTSLMAHWKFEGSSGATATDSSGNGNDLTLVNNPSRTTSGFYNQALSLDGHTQYLYRNSAFNYTTESFTISYWIYLNALTTDVTAQGPVTFYKGAYQSKGYYEQISDQGLVKFFTNQSGAFQASTTDTGVITSGRWYHIVTVREGASGRIYVDGQDRTTTAATHIDPASSADAFDIGLYKNQIHTNGLVDEIRVYQRALSAADVQELYYAERRTILNNARINNAVIP